MKTRQLHKTIASLFAAAGLAFAGVAMAATGPMSAEAYKAACVRAGQREGQYKPAVLQYRRGLKIAIDDYIDAPESLEAPDLKVGPTR